MLNVWFVMVWRLQLYNIGQPLKDDAETRGTIQSNDHSVYYSCAGKYLREA